MGQKLYQRRYFERFKLEDHREIVSLEQLKEIQEKFYLTTREMAYLFDIRTGTMKSILDKKRDIPFLIQLSLYYLIKDPWMIYALIKDKKKLELIKRKELERQGPQA